MGTLPNVLCAVMAASVCFAVGSSCESVDTSTNSIELSSQDVVTYSNYDFGKLFGTNNLAIATLGQRMDGALGTDDNQRLTDVIVELDALERVTGDIAPVITAQSLASTAAERSFVSDDIATLRTLARVLAPSEGAPRVDAGQRAQTLSSIQQMIARIDSVPRVRTRGVPDEPRSRRLVTVTVQNKTVWMARVALNSQDIGDVFPKTTFKTNVVVRSARLLFRAVAPVPRKQWGPKLIEGTTVDATLTR